MKPFFIILVSFFLVNSSFGADGKTLYNKCRGCHGIDGKHVPFERPQGILAGRDQAEIELLIKAVKDGSYPADKLNKIMRHVIDKFSDEDISTISAYIGSFNN